MHERPWLDQYSAGVPATIDPDRHASLAALLESSFERFGDRPAFTNFGETLTYRDVEHASRAFGAYLQKAGMRRGDRVAVMLPNLLQSPVVLFGALRAGCTVVNVNPLYTARELEHQLADSGASAIVVLENYAHTVEHALAKSPVKTVIVTRVGDHFAWPKREVVNFTVRRVRKLVPSWSIEGAVDYRTALAEGASAILEPPGLEGSDIAFLQYTGGTTGRPKGAMLTHRNMVANVLQAAAWASPLYSPDAGVVVTPLPLYHVYSLTANLFCFTEIGAHDLLITDPRDIRGFVRELSRTRFSFMTGVNTLFAALLRSRRFAALDFSALRVTMGGGMAVQREVAEQWKKVTGLPIAQGYGLTEASPIVCGNPLHLTQFNGSVGVPFPSTDVAIRDEQGAEVATGSVGEICVHGPQVMKGYWNLPEETAQVFFADGWLRTGDVGRMDARGFVFVEDRRKDVIVVSGFKVYPNEVEDVVTRHPGVLEAAAIGVADASSGEAVKLFVVRRDAQLSEADVIGYCRENLTGYKVPRIVEFIDELPKTNVGKVLRRALKAPAAVT